MGKETIAANIRLYRMMRGYTQRQLADKLYKTSAVICNWEKCINSPDLDSFDSLCKVLNCTPNELYGWEVPAEVKEFKKKNAMFRQDLDTLLKKRNRLDEEIEVLKKQFLCDDIV